MKDKDAIDMINRSVEEITSLRAQIDHLAPRAAAYDSIAMILGLLPAKSQGYGVDIVWQLKKQAAELASNSAQAPAAMTPASAVEAN